MMIECKIEYKEAYSFNNDTSDLVGIRVTGGSSVFEIALSVLCTLSGDTDTATTVGDTPAELVDASGLVAAGETVLVTLAVDSDVLWVTGLEFLHGGLDDLHATLGTHGSRGHVGMEAGAVPVTGDGLGSKADDDTEVFGDTVEEEAGHPELVTNCSIIS